MIHKNTKILSSFLKKDKSKGLMIISNPNNKIQKIPSLKYYFENSSTSQIIEHNLRWASGKESKPIFQFVYLMLPTKCNQKCSGCFLGQDKNKLPKELTGSFFEKTELLEIITFLKQHNTKTIVYGGGGELFTWNSAFDYIKTITDAGLKMVIFTNGTLLSHENIKYLNSIGAALIFSIRDTIEKYHNEIVGGDNFVKTLQSIEWALGLKMHLDNRLAVEIPITNLNAERVLSDFIPAMCSLGIAPMAEEYVLMSTSDEEKKLSHNFGQARDFFNKSCDQFQSNWQPNLGTRMFGQPKCRRPLYSFAIFPSRDVLDCPSHSICCGNLKNSSLEEIIYSDKFKKSLLDFNLCPCSVFYTETDNEIPKKLPPHLHVLTRHK